MQMVPTRTKVRYVRYVVSPGARGPSVVGSMIRHKEVSERKRRMIVVVK